ncbi:MAG: ABC transporter substrate-binding protein [Anaerolineae bacterium]
MAARSHRLGFWIALCWAWMILGALLPVKLFSGPAILPPVSHIFPRGELRIGVDPSYPPFESFTANDVQGIDIDIGRAIGTLYGIPVRFVYFGYDGLYDALYTDQVDMLISALPADPSRRNRVLYTFSYFDAAIELITPPGSAIQSMQDMGGKRLAYAFGSGAHSEADVWARRILPFVRMPYEFATGALDSVRLGQSDAALVDAVSMRLYARNHASWKPTIRPVFSIPYVIAIRGDREIVAVAVTNALETIRDSGELDMILARWL